MRSVAPIASNRVNNLASNELRRMCFERAIGRLMAGVALASVIAPLQAGEPFKPGKLSKEEQAALKPGLSLRFLDKENKPLDARRVRLAALHLGEAASA